MIEVRCYYEDIFFNIKVPQNETLYNLKHSIVSNLSSKGIKANEQNLNLIYGYPPQKIDKNISDKLTLNDLSIFDKDSLRIELNESNSEENNIKNSAQNVNVIDYSKYSIKKKDIPADNSCLFNAVNFAINQNADSPEIIRGIIASEIMANPQEYNSAVLDKEPEEYCKWIMKKETWGGGIELSILSKFFQIQIGVADIQHITIVQFGHNNNCIYLHYNNIHYDVFYKEENGKVTGIFNTYDERVKNEIMDICLQLQKEQRYIDASMFSVECMQCGYLLPEQKDVIEHSKKTGHINFKQIE